MTVTGQTIYKVTHN